MTDEIRFTLNGIVAGLRRDLASVTRDIGDLQRNAALWLAVRAGTPVETSSFALPRTLKPDETRFSEAGYLAALGYAANAQGWDLALQPSIRTALLSLIKRSPHTLERGGFADDPLCAAGLAILCRGLGLTEPATVIANAVAELTVSPSVAVILACAGAKRPSALPVDMSAGSLAAVMLCSRIDNEVAGALFPMDASTAEARLVHGLCRSTFTLDRSFDTMLALAALELAAATQPAASSPMQTSTASVQRTILFLAANPDSSNRLALDEEARAIETKLRGSEHRDAIRFRTRWAIRPDDLLQALNEDRPAVVHFSGHGSGAGGIVMHDESRGERLVTGSALRRLFSVMKDNIRVVVLSACYSAEQAREIAQVIDVVVGMADSVDDGAARTFAAAFYRALGFGHSVQNAFDQGLAAIELEGFDDVEVPEMVIRPGADPSNLVIV